MTQPIDCSSLSFLWEIPLGHFNEAKNCLDQMIHELAKENFSATEALSAAGHLALAGIHFTVGILEIIPLITLIDMFVCSIFFSPATPISPTLPVILSPSADVSMLGFENLISLLDPKDPNPALFAKIAFNASLLLDQYPEDIPLMMSDLKRAILQEPDDALIPEDDSSNEEEKTGWIPLPLPLLKKFATIQLNYEKYQDINTSSETDITLSCYLIKFLNNGYAFIPKNVEIIDLYLVASACEFTWLAQYCEKLMSHQLDPEKAQEIYEALKIDYQDHALFKTCLNALLKNSTADQISTFIQNNQDLNPTSIQACLEIMKKNNSADYRKLLRDDFVLKVDIRNRLKDIPYLSVFETEIKIAQLDFIGTLTKLTAQPLPETIYLSNALHGDYFEFFMIIENTIKEALNTNDVALYQHCLRCIIRHQDFFKRFEFRDSLIQLAREHKLPLLEIALMRNSSNEIKSYIKRTEEEHQLPYDRVVITQENYKLFEELTHHYRDPHMNNTCASQIFIDYNRSENLDLNLLNSLISRGIIQHVDVSISKESELDLLKNAIQYSNNQLLSVKLEHTPLELILKSGLFEILKQHNSRLEKLTLFMPYDKESPNPSSVGRDFIQKLDEVLTTLNDLEIELDNFYVDSECAEEFQELRIKYYGRLNAIPTIKIN